MTYTAAALKRIEPGTILAVAPHDAFPNGRWKGDAQRTLHGWAAREAVPARLVRIERVAHPEGDGASTAALLAYCPPATGTDHFLPQAIVGTWDELQAVRAEIATTRAMAERANAAAMMLGPGVYAAERITDGHAVAMSIDAAERLARAAHNIRTALNAARATTTAAEFVARVDDAHRWAAELLDPNHV